MILNLCCYGVCLVQWTPREGTSADAIGYIYLMIQISMWVSNILVSLYNDSSFSIKSQWNPTMDIQHHPHALMTFTLTCSLTQCGRCDVDMVLIPGLVLKFHTTCLWKWDPAVPVGGDLKLGVVSEVFSTNTSSEDWSDLCAHLLQRRLTAIVIITMQFPLFWWIPHN